jgi:hypothetical protein
LCVAVVHTWWGWPVSLYFALSLPVAGLVAHYYVQSLGTFVQGMRTTWVLWRAPALTRKLLSLRTDLRLRIEREQQTLPRPTAAGTITEAK